MSNGRQLDKTALFEFAQQGAGGDVLELTGVGAPVPGRAQVQRDLTTRKGRLAGQ